jgi:hypothetical protein
MYILSRSYTRTVAVTAALGGIEQIEWSWMKQCNARGL